jgi:hypothetical protein
VSSPQFSVGLHGVSYAPCQSSGGADRRTPIHLLNPATGQGRRISAFGDNGFFTVSRDGRTIVYSQQAGSGADLMLIENFK